MEKQQIRVKENMKDVNQDMASHKLPKTSVT